MSTSHTISLHQSTGANSAADRLTLRLRVYATRGRLDRQIAAGGQQASTAALALRARQLAHPRTRMQAARSLRKIVDYADYRASHRGISAVVIEPTAVRRARHPILGLAERLEAPHPLNPEGVARVQVLLTDGRGPLFNHNSEQTVTQAIWQIQDALEAPAIGSLEAPAR
jgi:hypothetical protein